MKKIYKFDYNSLDAEVIFEVDLTKFTEFHAKLLLEFFTWSWDETESPIDEIMKKICNQSRGGLLLLTIVMKTESRNGLKMLKDI